MVSKVTSSDMCEHSFVREDSLVIYPCDIKIWQGTLYHIQTGKVFFLTTFPHMNEAKPNEKDREPIRNTQNGGGKTHFLAA